MAFKIKTARTISVPDERHVMESMARMRRDMGVHAKALWVLIGSVITVAIVAGGIYFVNAQAEQTAKGSFQQATQLYMNRPLSDTDAALSHVRQSVELLRSVLEDHPKTSSAPPAMHLLGNALAVLGDHEGAIATYQKFLEEYPSSGPLSALVRQRLAYAHLNQGDFQRAERVFETILTIDKAPNKDLALLELGSLGEQQNQSESAMSRYQELIKGYPHSIYLSEASSKVSLLGGGSSAVESPLPTSTVVESDLPDESTASP
tara:strand:- start:1320 stop:2105 length:786 start_codon:yes stop_codon:yes gene_type:complete